MKLRQTLNSKRGVNVSLLVTFDPHSLTGDLQLTFNNVGVAINFYQQNLTTGIFGQNPFFGQRINSGFINVKNHNATGYYWVNHLNIIEFATKNYNYGFFGF